MHENNHMELGLSSVEAKKFKRYAWIYLLMFSVLYCFLYCTRLNISSATPYLIAQGWEESTIGIMTGTLFWTYGIGQLICGRLSEQVGPSKMVVAAVILSAMANFLIATQETGSVVILALIWGANGLFQSMGWTPGIAALTRWWPGKSRGFAVGFANAFSGFGQVAAFLAILAAYTWFPQSKWQASFLIPPLFPLAVLVLYLLFVKATPEKAGLRDYEENDREKTAAELQMHEAIKGKGALYPYKFLLSNKKFLVWIVISFSSGLARYGLSTWIPLYFTEQGLSAMSSVASSVILPIGMGIGTWVVPWLTDRFCPNDRMPAAIISAVIGAITTIAIFMLDATQLPQLITIEVLLFIAGFCIYAINGIMFTYATDVGGRVFSGTCSGVLNFSAYMGAAVQSFVYGFVLDNSGWAIVFISIAAFNVLIAVLGLIGSKKHEYK
jgi:sugar phosphate permease